MNAPALSQSQLSSAPTDKALGSEYYLWSCTPETFKESEYLRAVAADYGFTPAQLKEALSTSKGRVLACKHRPLLWTLLHAHSALELKDGPYAGEVTMSTFSLDFFRNVKSWCQPNLSPGEGRICEVCARESGKSQLLAVVGPAYLLCTSGRREYVCVFAADMPHAKSRMSDIRSILSRASVVEDYPGVAAAKRGSFSESDSMFKFKMANGSILTAMGIGASGTSGLLEGGQRVTLSVLDDISPAGGEWSATEDQKRLTTIRQVIYKLGQYQRIWWVGTTTAYGSLVHEMLGALQTEDSSHWSVKDKWDVRYHAPIVQKVTESGIEQESYWPRNYPLSYILQEREDDPWLFGINWANDPMAASDGTWWLDEDFIIGQLSAVTYRVISVDPGVSDGKKTNDANGISVISFSTHDKKACVDEVAAIHANSVDLKRYLLQLKAKYPDISHLIWETNNGGESLMYSTCGYDFPAKLVPNHVPAGQDKITRARILLNRYKLGQIVHRTKFHEYVTEAKSMPLYKKSPNMIDSVGQGIQFIATMGQPSGVTAKVRRA